MARTKPDTKRDDRETGKIRYSPRRADETEEQYGLRVTKAHAQMSALMSRTRRPWEYD